MSYDIKIDHAAGVSRVTLSGTTTSGEILKVLRDLAPDGRFVTEKRIWDMRGVTSELTSAEAEDVAQVALSRDGNSAGMVAIVASRDVIFGVSRVFEVFRSSAEVQVRVFRDLDEALRWLEE